MKKIFTLFTIVFLSVFIQAKAQVANHVVISQIYGAGGNTNAVYQNDYVELFNPTAADIPLAGYSIQYASAAGNSWVNKIDLVGTIQAGRYFLVSLAGSTTNGAALPAPDQTGLSAGTGSVNMSGTAGKVALVNSTTVLTGTCPTDATIVDFLGYGTTASCSEPLGAPVAPASAASTANALFRNFGGCVDLNVNALDFTAAPPAPRNSSTANNCGFLPLSLTSFNGSFNGKSAGLKWTTANESNVKGFSIERSLNGTIFTEVGFVKAQNKPSNSYSYDDAAIKAGVNFYRIKMIDNDGSSKFSAIVAVNNKSGMKATIFPNPVRSNLTVNHTKAEALAIIRILSVEGKPVKTVAVQNGSVQTAVSVSELVNGNYLLIFENNGEKVTTKFSKQ